ncbi:MAG: hypothetical protein LW808_000825 [Verrucomicrobiota bacterium]|nr:MAG: hypothetical protein LW808_000825 [Verrucomicrobiota bacterium]
MGGRFLRSVLVAVAFFSSLVYSLRASTSLSEELDPAFGKISSSDEKNSWVSHEEIMSRKLREILGVIDELGTQRVSIFIDIDDTFFLRGSDFNSIQRRGSFEGVRMLYPDLFNCIKKLSEHPRIDVHFLTNSSPWHAFVLGRRLVFSPLEFSPYDQWNVFDENTSFSQVRIQAIHTVGPSFGHNAGQPARVIALEWAPISSEDFSKASKILVTGIDFKGTVNGKPEHLEIDAASEIFASQVPVEEADLEHHARILRKRTKPNAPSTFFELAALTVEQAGIIFYIIVNERYANDKARSLISFYKERYGDDDNRPAVISIDDRQDILDDEDKHCQAVGIPFFSIRAF